MFKKLTTAIAFVCSVQAADINTEFDAYLTGSKTVTYEIFEKMWTQFENEFTSQNLMKVPDAHRKNHFQETIESIIKFNSNLASPYKKGINKFSDLSDQEFKDFYMIKENSLGEPQHCSATGERMSVAKGVMMDRQPEWDWRQHDGVSPVKNQGHCGSCWTFSTVGTLEAHELIKYGEFTSLAEQQLVDCAGDFDNHGCNGGLPSHAFEYIMHAGGISTEDAYPYFAADHNCTVKADTFALTVPHGSVNITEGDEEELADALFAHGPVSIAFQVVDGFRDYASGVYVSDVCKNSTADVNHAVVAVGYGTCPKTGLDYWIVKNSWGADWGDQGFFKIERGVNMCGVAVCNSFPAVVERVNHVETFLQ